MKDMIRAAAAAVLVAVLLEGFVHRAAVAFAAEVTRQIDELESARETDRLGELWEEHENGDHEQPLSGCPECEHDLAMEAR